MQHRIVYPTQEKKHLLIRKNSQPLNEQFAQLLCTDIPLIAKEVLPVFTDSYDQLSFVMQTTDSCRELISSLVDLYISNNNMRMHAIMKRLTVVSTIFIPLTF